MEIAEIKQILSEQDSISQKIWCKTNLSTIIDTFKTSKLSQSEFSLQLGLEAKYFYTLINLARVNGLLPLSKMGLSRMRKQKRSKISKSDFSEVSIQPEQLVKTKIIYINIKDIRVDVFEYSDAIAILRGLIS